MDKENNQTIKETLQIYRKAEGSKHAGFSCNGFVLYHNQSLEIVAEEARASIIAECIKTLAELRNLNNPYNLPQQEAWETGVKDAKDAISKLSSSKEKPAKKPLSVEAVRALNDERHCTNCGLKIKSHWKREGGIYVFATDCASPLAGIR